MAEKEQTEKEKEAKELQEGQMAQYLSNAMIIGANTAKKWGEQGDYASDYYFNKGEGLKRKQEIDDINRQNYEALGINFDYQPVTNGALVYNTVLMNQGSEKALTLGNLEKIVDQIDPTKKFKVVDKFKNYTGEQVQELLDKKDLSEEEKDLKDTYMLLRSSYQTGAPLTFMLQNASVEANARGNEIFEKYNPKKEENKK